MRAAQEPTAPPEPQPVRQLTDLPPELWESSLRHLGSLREKSACTRLCKPLSLAAHTVVNESVRDLKEELLNTLRPCHAAQPESTSIDSYELDTLFTAGGALLKTALRFGGPGHLCGYPSVRFDRPGAPSTGGFHGKKNFQCRPETRVLHAGAMLRVRLSADTRRVLGDAAFDDIMLTVPNASRGFWTCDDVVKARERVLRPMLEKHVALFEKDARARGRWDVDSPPADAVEVQLSMQRFGLEEVVLMMGAVAYNQEFYWDNI